MRAVQFLKHLAILAMAASTVSGSAYARCDSVEFEAFHVGNGGDVVVHRVDGNVDAIELLDFYEGRTLVDGFKVSLGDANLSVEAKVQLGIKRLAAHDAGRAERYQQWLAAFPSDACFMTGIQLTDIPDSAHVQLPAGQGWGIEQIAIHSEPLMPEDHRYVVNADLWKLLDNDGKAGLILHELIYRDAVAAGVTHSRGVRALNRYVVSEATAQWDYATYVDRLERVELADVSYRGLWIDLKAAVRPSFRADGTLANATSVPGTAYASAWGTVVLDCRLAFTADGRIRGFSVQSRVAPGAHPSLISIGSLALEIVPPSFFGRQVDCGTADRPRYDVITTDPDAPDHDKTRVMTATRIPLAGPGFSASITEEVTFIDGHAISGVVDPLAAPAWVEESGRTCELKRGGLAIADGQLQRASFRKCKVTRGANTFYASGAATWAAASEGRVLADATLATSQTLQVGSQAIGFSKGAPVSFYASGEVKRGQLLRDTQLVNEQGEQELFFEGAAVAFTLDGRALRHPIQ